MNFGYFEGEVITKRLKGDVSKDRTMALMEDFSYIDPSGRLTALRQAAGVPRPSLFLTPP